jgi:hypothetical protein
LVVARLPSFPAEERTFNRHCNKQTSDSPNDSSTGAQADNLLSVTDDKNDTDSADDSNGTDGTDDTSATDADSDDGGVSILESILSPPESDPDSKPPLEQQYVRAFHVHYAPTRRFYPFIPQRPDPSKERKGEFNCRQNKINLCRKLPKTCQASSDNDGANKQDDDLPASARAPPSTLKATTHLAPPNTPRPMTRS